MELIERLSRISPVARFINHIQTPLYRNGYALVFSSVASSGLGMVYWVVAARQYGPAEIGLNSALLSIIQFLVNLAQFNLANLLNRFIPAAGRSTLKLVLATYLLTSAVSLVLGIVFIAGVQIWSPTLGFLQNSSALAISFTLSVVTLCIFSLQDSVLAGLRQATIVPIENIAFGVMKIAFLFVFAVLLPEYGVVASWMVAALITLVPINYLIFRRLIPRHMQIIREQVTQIVPRKLAIFAAGDYLGSMAANAASSLLPLIIIERLGAVSTAYFFMAWTVAYSIYLVSRNMGMSLITEAAADLSKINLYGWRILVQSSRMVFPLVALLVIGAPLFLRLFGSEYATEAPDLFRLLCLSAIPNNFISLYISLARIRQQVGKVLLVQLILNGLSLAMTFYLLGIYGIVGIGWAMLLSATLVAVFLLLTELRPIWLPQINLKLLMRALSYPRQRWWLFSHRHEISQTAAITEQVLTMLPDVAGTPPASTWTSRTLLPTESDVIVFRLGQTEAVPLAIIKVPFTEKGRNSLKRETAILATLRRTETLGDWAELMPSILYEGRAEHSFCIVEQVVPGIEARQVMTERTQRDAMRRAAANAIGQLHLRTGALTAISTEMVDQWVDQPLNVLRSLYVGQNSHTEKLLALDLLDRQLHQALAGSQTWISWVHGDFAPRNIIVSQDASTVTGILDWESATPSGLPQLDLIQLFVSIRMNYQHKELGYVTSELLSESNWTADERELLNQSHTLLPGDALDNRALVLISWLHHVSANLEKSVHYRSHRWWLAQNIENVLNTIKA